MDRQPIGSQHSKDVAEQKGLITIGKVQRAFVAFLAQLNDCLPGFVKLVGQPQILQLNLTANKLLIELGERSIKALEQI